MKKIIASTVFLLVFASTSFVHGMWYAVDPENQNAIWSSKQKSALQQKMMVAIALHDSNLDGDAEIEKLDSYCQRFSKKEDNAKLIIPCPDPECDSMLSANRSMRMHWYAFTAHQPKLHDMVSGLIVQDKHQAKVLYAKKRVCHVVPFPIVDANPENEDVEQEDFSSNEKKRGSAVSELQNARGMKRPNVNVEKPLAKPVTYYLLEALPGEPGAFSTFIESSRENLLLAYLKSRQLEAKPFELEALKIELRERTKKQQMVQGEVVRSLVCPAPGCRHQCKEDTGCNKLEKIIEIVVMHYAAYHRQDHPSIKSIADLIATSFDQARKNIEKGKML